MKNMLKKSNREKRERENQEWSLEITDLLHILEYHFSYKENKHQ
jgi:hypothetical protein